jgi:RNA polymerase sigma-70 factor (ECF subfamily)
MKMKRSVAPGHGRIYGKANSLSYADLPKNPFSPFHNLLTLSQLLDKRCDQPLFPSIFFAIFAPHFEPMAIYSKLEDHDLLILMQKGKEAAFTEIYNRYWEKLVAIGYYYTRTKQSAEEIVNDVLIGLWLKREELVIRSLSAYLGTAVKFAVFKAISRRKRREEILAGQVPVIEGHNETEQQLDALFLQDFLAGVVEQLPEKAKLAFKYSREDELSIVEIAGKMDLSPKSVEYHMTKALKAIRDSIRKMNIFLLTTALVMVKQTLFFLSQL